MFYVYIVLSAALIPISNIFFNVRKESYSWWLVPLLFVGFFAAFVILQLLFLAVSSLFISVDKPADKGSRFYRTLVTSTIILLFKLARVHINTKGLEKVPESRRFLLVCNHQHDFDPAVILSVLPNAGLGFIGKKEIYKTMPFVAKFMHKLYCLPIDRENDREAAKTVVSAIKLIKEDKASVGIFPEGYTSKTCELLPLRNGAFKIAMKARVPVVVCVINNTREIVKRMFRRRTDVEFRVLDTIYPEQYESMNTSQIGDIVHGEMLTALKELRG